MHARIYIFIEAESITRFLILEKQGCQSDIRPIEIKLTDVKENLHKSALITFLPRSVIKL